MSRKLNPRPALRLPTSIPAGTPPPYELEFESIQARDQNALTRRAAAGWRIVWLLTSSKNVPDGQGGNPLQTFWDILWERPVPIVLPAPPSNYGVDATIDTTGETPTTIIPA